MCEFHPVSDAAVVKSDKLFAADYRSLGFQMVSGFRNLAAPIIYLHHSAKAMFLLYCENGNSIVAASETFNIASETLLDLIDSAIADVPTDLLVLIAEDGVDIFRVDEAQTIGQILSRAAEYECANRHSLVRLQARLLRSHCETLGRAGYRAFRRAMVSLRSIGLFEGDQVSPLALDFFPSLADRENELVMRRAELKWRPETPDDRAVAT